MAEDVPDLQRVPGPDGTWRVERSEDAERIVDPKGNERYRGRHSMTAAHFALAMRREDEYRLAVEDAYRTLGGPFVLSGDAANTLIELRKRLAAVLKVGPEHWERLDVPGSEGES